MSSWSVTDGWDPRPLRGEVAMVTGALGGLGRPMVEALAAAGASVVVHHLRQESDAAEAVRALTEAGARAVAVEADLTDWDVTARAFEEVEKSLGSVSVLVNNAGMMRKQSFRDLALDAWKETIDVDLTSSFIATRLALPSMLTAGRGVIINVASQLAFRGAPDYVSYSAAKAGIVGMTRALAREVGPAVRVNAIAPGPIETPMTDAYTTPEWVAERTAGLVIGRLGKPEEIAASVVFLASAGASLLHGQTLHLNGGGVMA